MPSPLERAPIDIIKHIAFHCSPLLYEPAINIRSLLLTSRAINRALNRHTSQHASHLYADIFRDTFDTIPTYRRTGVRVPDSGLAAELVQRHITLRKIYRREDISAIQDLWTLLLMVIESDGKNEGHLAVADFYHVILELAMSVATHSLTSEVTSLIIWLLCLTSSRGLIASEATATKERVLATLRPLAKASCWMAAPPVMSYGHRQTLRFPDVSSAAIVLIFSWSNTLPLEPPPHFPSSRAGAAPGPTVADYKRMIACASMPLVGDAIDIARSSDKLCRGSSTNHDGTPCLDETDASRSVRHDATFAQMVSLPAYKAGSMAGLWEGTYLISSLPASSEPTSSNAAPSLDVRAAVQCLFREDLDNCHGSAKSAPASDDSLRAITPARVLLIGQTTPEHAAAWGGYLFEGSVRLFDGRITFNAQSTSEPADVWEFSGYLNSGTFLVGRWKTRSLNPNVPSTFDGILQMRKITAS